MNKKAFIKEAASYAVIFAVCMLAFTVVFKIAVVDGNSMNDTYMDSDVLLCLRLGKPKRGDVIVCDSNVDRILIKRVIATGGDTVFIDFEAGEVKVNDEVLSEPYIKEPTHLNEGGFEYPITVPEGCYFVMGDNRNYSSDSRNGNVGFITDEQIQAKVLLRL